MLSVLSKSDYYRSWQSEEDKQLQEELNMLVERLTVSFAWHLTSFSLLMVWDSHCMK